ncbi:MAG: HEAT repeat domain-containing protein [Deltaproteobacteria bacterium]|nr:HEAT repeat domain-containing protein [Deltaproteobacteria bacterium]
MACLHYHSESTLLGGPAGDAGKSFPEPGVEPNYAPSRSVRIEHIDLRLDLYPEERRFEGEARVRVEPLPSFLGKVHLDLDEVVVDEVTDEAGGPLAFLHDDGVLEVRDVEAPLTVVVRWHGENPRLGLYFTGPEPWAPDRPHMGWTQCQDEDGHYLFPCHDHPRVKHAWRIHLTGPTGHTLLSNGTQVEVGERDGRAFAVYEQPEPMPAYLFTAICARLSMVEANWRGVPVRYLVPEGREEPIQRAMGKTPEMLEEFSRITGVDYPWPRYDQVVVDDFVFGGMENVSCTTMTDLLLVDEKAMVEWDPDGLVSHELAHQWFGDLVTCQDWSQSWLNESWATFMEVVWWEHDRTPALATWYRWQLARDYFEEDSGRYRRPIVSYRFRNPIDVFDRHLYQKGGCVLSTLRAVLGEDAFWTGVHTYLERHAHDTVHGRHFQRALEDATGRNLDRFFAEWIEGAGHPALKVKLTEEEGLLTVAVKQVQEGKETAEAFAFPLRLGIITASGERTVDLPVKERERTWAIPVEEDIRAVRVDPGFRVLAEMALDAPRGWLVALLDDACPVLSVRAAEALLAEGSKTAFQAVVKAQAAHPDYHVRQDLARQLGKICAAEVRDLLVARLSEEADPRVRRAVCDALGTYRDETAADALLGVLDSEVETWALTGAALKSLGKTRDKRARAVLERHLAMDSWAEVVRRAALEGLASTKDAGTLETLRSYTRIDQPERLRAAAAEALGRLGDKVHEVRDAICERMVQMLEEPGFRSQVGAIDALGTLKHPDAVAALRRTHRSATDSRSRRLAWEALQKTLEGRTAGEGLAALRDRVEALANENSKLRQRLDKLESRIENG